jgi:molybdate transport system ATP-binding protein
MLKPLAPRHSVRIRHRIGALHIDVDFELTEPWTILFGPSGSGKTTLLRVIAGLLRPDYGRIVSTIHPGTDQERSFTFVDTDAGVFMPAQKRVVRFAPQQPSLFPHKTVLENMKYGMLFSYRDAEEIQASETYVRNLLARFSLTELADKRPHELSGGEAQRVNLARAFATGAGRLLLLDEPFTGLDDRLKDGLIAELSGWNAASRQQILSVTHNVAEAFQLDADVIKLAEGRVVEQGPVATVLAEERARLLEQLSPSE